ncbi:hypothetical protein [Curvibacter gracilis]|uniref:aggregation-promoting factor C-terminal-like domain-containing protein n=1 Tax=Curvibacter gracilis TaxID=230310 RepID=UPI0004879106|nr:hypothetical protein [Curvibacter gracilis]
MGKMHTHGHSPIKRPVAPWVAQSPMKVPQSVQQSLKEAMRLEDVPSEQFDDLLWIMAQESGGVVGVRNEKSTARGLYQLLRAQYDLNPKGERSFGNAIEECQGGIRYILGRYRTAQAARAFWERHHWY